MKRDEHAQSEELDTLMKMIGLENVKRDFLDIESHVDVTIRQCVSLDKERFGCTLLGNPGTGKYKALHCVFWKMVGSPDNPVYSCHGPCLDMAARRIAKIATQDSHSSIG